IRHGGPTLSGVTVRCCLEAKLIEITRLQFEALQRPQHIVQCSKVHATHIDLHSEGIRVYFLVIDGYRCLIVYPGASIKLERSGMGAADFRIEIVEPDGTFLSCRLRKFGVSYPAFVEPYYTCLYATAGDKIAHCKILLNRFLIIHPFVARHIQD